eukprot:958871_1
MDFAYKSKNVFTSGRFTVCTACKNMYMMHYRRTLRGFIITLHHNAKHNVELKSLMCYPERKIFTLTQEDVFVKILTQRFRCYYSGIPMIFKAGSDWQCSIERIDNEKGYTTTNCVLICREFNSSDYSLGALASTSGSPQWNQAKFQTFYDRVARLPV